MREEAVMMRRGQDKSGDEVANTGIRIHGHSFFM